MAGAILLAWYDRSKMHFNIHGVKIKVPCPVITGRIQIRVLTYCQAISTEIDTDSFKI